VTDQLVQVLIPMLTDRPQRRFNVFEVMHHGTHEKQLSNVFAWLLNTDGTHNLGDAFQRIFLAEVNRELQVHGEQPIAEDSYGVRQEVNTSAMGDGEDIADIVLDGSQTTIVVENYFSSDGHGHSYYGYRSYGARQTQRSVVVLLCEQEIRSALTDGWQNAPVVLYSTLLTELLEHVHQHSGYRSEHVEQVHFIENMHRHFTNRMAVTMNRDGLISFVDAMCRGGEADSYGAQRPEEAARRLGDRLREEAIQRFGESRELLGKTKSILRSYCAATLGAQVNQAMGAEVLGEVYVRWSGIHLWSVSFKTHPAYSTSHSRDFVAHLEFGPSAWHALNRGRWKAACGFEPDYTRIFILDDHGDKAAQSTVEVAELLEGLAPDDHRLRDEIIELLRSSPHSLDLT
jgi:hypothetical protein